MTNILIAFTGGTIGSSSTDGTIAPADSSSYQLLDLFQQHYPDSEQVTFHTIQPLKLLSENLAPPAWKMLINALEAEGLEQYDGIVITHGTDTLAYTAAMLSFYFSTISRPMLLVSSNYPLNHPQANGLDNFICAVDFIRQINEAGVFVPYRNPQQTSQVHRGVHLTSSLQLSGDFFSIQGKSYMAFTGRQFSQLNPKADNTKSPKFPLSLQTVFSDRIALIRPYPGLNYHTIDLHGVDAVLHDLYHSGTACVSEQWGSEHSLLPFLARCRDANIKIYLAPAIASADAYQTTRVLIAAGAEMIWNMSIEAAYCKLVLAYGNFSDEQQILEFINSNDRDERIKSP